MRAIRGKKTFIRGRSRWQVNDPHNSHAVVAWVLKGREGAVDCLQEFDAEPEEHSAGTGGLLFVLKLKCRKGGRFQWQGNTAKLSPPFAAADSVDYFSNIPKNWCLFSADISSSLLSFMVTDPPLPLV